MLRFAPIEIEAALLYPGPCPNVAFPDILDHLNQSFAGVLEPFRHSAFATPASAMFTGSGLFILVSKNPQPLEPQGFAQTLASPFTRMTFDGAGAIVARHKSNVFVTVSHEPPMGDASRDLMAKLGMTKREQKRELFEMKLAICKMLVQFLIARARPLAIHWCQSSQLLRPDYFEALAASTPLPTPLFVHPSFFSSTRIVAGKRIVGARGCCAEHLINRSLVFNEAPMPFGWIYERICDFVDMVRARGGELIPDGDSFGAGETEIVRVRHEGPSEAEPAGAIVLTFESGDDLDLAARAPKAGAAGVLGGRMGRVFH